MLRGTRARTLFGHRRLLLDLAPGADLQPATHPAQHLGLLRGAIAAANPAAVGFFRFFLDRSLSGCFQQVGRHGGAWRVDFHARPLPHATLLFPRAISITKIPIKSSEKVLAVERTEEVQDVGCVQDR